MRVRPRFRGFVGVTVLVAGAGVAHAQYFSLDDNPTIPFAAPPVPGLWSAEDPYGIGTPPVAAFGIGGPSPSLAFGYFDGEILGPFVPGPPHLVLPNGSYLNAVSPNRRLIGPDIAPEIALDFSVDRGTQGLPGSALFAETVPFGPLGVQQAGDIYRSTISFAHPGFFVGSLTPGIVGAVPTFGGILPTAGVGGSNFMVFDESVLGLTVAGAPGVLTPPGVPAPAPPLPMMHDNVDAYSNTAIDLTGDLINDVEFFFSIAPAEAVLSGGALSSSDMFDVAPGAGGSPGIPYAPSFVSGMDFFGFASDDIDALVVWDHGAQGGPGFGGPGAEPIRDYALFSLGEGSATLTALLGAGIPVNGSTVFFTDFTGAFGIYALDTDIGVDPIAAGFFAPYANVDALDIVPAPPTLWLVALLGLAGVRRRR